MSRRASPVANLPAPAEAQDDLWRVFESTNDGITISTLDGRLVEVNPAMCAMHGYTREEFLALPPAAHVHPDYRAERGDLYARIRDGGSYRMRARNLRKDGSELHIEVHGTGMQFRGQPHVLSVVRDISDQVRSEQLLEQRVEQRTHELATLLDVARTTASELDLTSLIDRVFEQLRSVLDYSAVLITVEEHGRTVILARRGPGVTPKPGPGGFRRAPLFKQLHDSGVPVVIDDVRGQSVLAAAYRDQVGSDLNTRLKHVQSYMQAPLRGRAGYFGALACSWHERGRYGEAEGRLFMAFADHVAVAIENARLFEERQRRSQELATLLDVARDTTSTLQLDETLRRIMERMGTVISCSAVSISIHEGEDTILLARQGPGDVQPGLRRRRPALSLDRLNGGSAVIIDDVRGDSPEALAYRELVGDVLNTGFAHVQSYMTAPLVGRDGVFGAIAVSWHEKNHFTADDGRLMAAFADHAALAIQNARLFEDSQRSAEELETLLEVAQSTAELTSLPELLDTVMNQLSRVMQFNVVAVVTFEGDDAAIIGRMGAGQSGRGATFPGGRTSRLGKLLETEDTLRIDDVRDDSDPARMYREVVGQEFHERMPHVRSWMCAALRDRVGLRGLLSVSSPEVGYYGEEDARLLAAFAGHVAVAIVNAGLFDETQRRAREMEALHRADEALNRSLRLDDVLQAMVDLAIELLGADVGLLYMLDQDSDSGRVVATSGLSEAVRALVVDRAGRSGAPMSAEMVVSEDARNDPLLDAAIVEATGVRSLVELRISAGGQLCGSFGIGFQDQRSFSDADRQLFATLATRAGLAIENARLFDETQRRAREMEALHRADEALNRSLRLDDVLQAMVDLAVELLGADASALYTWDSETGTGDVAAMSGFSEENRELVRRRFRESPGRPPPTNDVSISEDPSNDPALDPVIVEATGVRSLVELPILAGGEVFGVFAIGFLAPRTFSDGDRQLFATLATRAGLAVHNAQLYERAQQTASLEERQRLARELHDSVSQALYGIALGTRTARKWLDRDPARVAEPLDYALGLAEVGLAEMRALIFELRPETLESEGLVAALQRQAAMIGARYEIEVVSEFCDEPPLQAPVREALYRIAQEAMHNTVKHASASRIELRISRDEAATRLEVADNGAGFDPNGNFPGHLGLRSMRERAERLGAAFDVQSGVGAGTRILVTVT